MDSGGIVHELDVDPRQISRNALFGVKGDAARQKAYDALRTIIRGRRRAP